MQIWTPGQVQPAAQDWGGAWSCSQVCRTELPQAFVNLWLSASPNDIKMSGYRHPLWGDHFDSKQQLQNANLTKWKINSFENISFIFSKHTKIIVFSEWIINQLFAYSVITSKTYALPSNRASNSNWCHCSVTRGLPINLAIWPCSMAYKDNKV